MGEVEQPPWLKALPQAPEFYPTEAEFADPIAYILKVEEEAKQYGICKIIPPFTKASKKVVVNNLNRSLSMSFSNTVQEGSCAPLSRSMGGAMGGPQLAKPKGLFLDASCTDLGNKAKFATRRQQLGWNPKRARGVAHSQNHKLVWQSGESYTLEQFETKAKMFSRSRLGTCKDVSPLSVESLFWRAAADKPISVEYANDIPGSAFAESADSFSLTPLRLKKRKRALEDTDQRNLDSIFMGCRSEEKFLEEDVQATSEEFDPSDAAKAKNGSLEAGGDNAGGAGSKLANSAWNMRNVARSQGSLLRFMPEEVPGVTSPMVYIGMLFSWFAWHVEDHELHSLNYLHMGASKTWYAVPGDAAPALEEAIRVHGYGGYLNPRAAFSLLGEKTTVMSPEVLVAAGVPCCRLVQNAGEYVVTFPRAYHLGFSHGFNCGEAANFATPGWLAVAKEAAARRAAMNYLPMLSHQQLLYLLTMSLPLRMPASCPSEPRSSRLKVRKKSAGEEMVKSMFLHDVVHNNRLLRILLDNGVSRCLLANDAVHQIPTMAALDDSKHNGVPPLGAMESALHVSVPEFCSEGGDGSHLPSQQVSVAEETEDPIQSQLPSCAPVPSKLRGAIFEDLVKVSSVSTDPSSVMSPGNEQAPHYVETHPIHLKNQKLATSLAVDWGTLPCAACGILCYATMAVVEPTVTAAMTFKPIFAAAGLGHCAFEAGDSGTMTPYLPAFSHPRSIQVEASRDNNLVSSFQPACIEGSIKQDEQGSTLAGVPEFSSKSPVVIEFAGQIRPTEHGRFSSQGTAKPSEEVQGSVDTLAITTHFDSKEGAGCLGHHNLQMSDTGLAMDMKSGMFTGLVNTEQNSKMGNCDIHCSQKDPGKVTQEGLGVCIVTGKDCTTDLGTTSDAKALESEDLNGTVACGESCSTMPSGHSLLVTPMPVSICQKTESQIIPCIDEQPKMCPLKSLQNNDPNCVRIEGSPKAAKVCCEQEKQPWAFSVEEHGNSNGSGVSSLQLLASNYDDSSDLEDENIIQAAKGCIGLLEDETSVDDADGSEVLARPHSGVGDLLTDEIGLSADVPWLSLLPVTENTDIPAPTAISPSFIFSSLVEGPKSLENVFISAGFSFLEEDDTADPASLGSSLTGEQLGKRSGEAASVDGDLNNPTSGDSGNLIDMQELYHRINSQALTVESDEDEQLLIHFGLRPPRCGVPQESFDLEEPKSISSVASVCQLEPKNLSVTVENTSTSSIPSTMGLGLNNPSPSSAPSYLGLAGKNPLKESGAFDATADIIRTGSVSRLNEEMSVGGTSSITSTQEEAAYPQMKVYTKKTGSLVQESKHAPPRACNSVARPRVLCLEHAVEAQQQLRSVGGAHVLIVCHSDFENYELRAKHLTEEFGIEHTWRHVPFSEAADDEISMVSTAADVDDDGGRRVNDWVMQMGLFFHHRFQERESESSDDTLNVTEDFRAGPFSGVKPGKPAGRRLMAGRLGLSHNSEGHPISCSGRSSQITVRDSRRLSKTSKKKKCMVAGKWCGRVWRVNQVHPFLGGCRKVDPSLQLGMSSTSLYALSVMSECDGGKYRKGISSSRIEASPSGFLIPVKSTEDQQSIAVRNRGRKRKVLDQGMPVQQDNGSEGERRMVPFSTDCTQSTLAVCMVRLESGDCSSSPKEHGTLTESVGGSGCLDITINVAEESFNVDDCQHQLTTRMFPHCAHQPDADPAVQTANTDFSCPCVHQMLSPIPLASRDPSETEDKNNGLNIESKEPTGEQCGALDKYIPTAELAGGKECCGPNDNIGTVISPPLPVPSEAQQVADVKVLELPLVPSAVSLGSTQIEPRPTAEEDSGWHKTASLTNVYSTLPLIRRVVKMVKSNNGSNSSPVSSSTPFEGNKISGTGNAASCVWRDVPVACAPSFHALTTPLAGQFTNQFAHPFPNRNHNHVYIPYVSAAVREATTDHTLESQTSPNELYSLASKSFTGFEQGGIKLQDVHLLQGKDARHIPETGTSDGNLDQGSPNVSSKSSTGKPILYIEHGTSVQHLETSKLLGAKRNRDRQIEPVYPGGNSMDAGVPSLLDIGTGSQLVAHAENCCEGQCECRDLQGSISEQVVCKVGTLQQSQQDIKNVVRLSDVGVPFASALAEEQASASHLNVCRTQDGRSTSNDSDPVHLQDAHHQNYRLYDKKLSVELTPVLSFAPSLIRSPHQGTRGGSGILGFASDTGQGVALEDPVGSLLPQRASSRGRSAVKARGKRPKHVGWTHHKPAHPEIPGEISVNTWALTPHSSAQVPKIFTLQPEECVEARFEAEDCDRVVEGLDRSKGPTSLIPSLGLQALAGDDNESEEENDKPKKIAAKSKKKSKPKKKRVPTRKPVHEDGEFQCDLDGCRMSFASDAELQIHKRNRCTFKGCGKRFFMHKYLLQHRRVHLDERPLKCPWKGCKQAFKWAWARTEHIRVHTGERPYACPDCDQTFRFVSDFSRHKRNTGHTKS